MTRKMVNEDIATYNDTVVDEKEERCYIRFSLKWNKVHVHKSTVEMLNRPRYIQILINKDRKTLIIRGCDKKRPDSFRVPENLLLKAHTGFYLNSKLFTDMIIKYLNWNYNLINTSS